MSNLLARFKPALWKSLFKFLYVIIHNEIIVFFYNFFLFASPDHQTGKGHKKDHDQGLLLLEEIGRGEKSQIVGKVPHAPLPEDKDHIRHHPPRNWGNHLLRTEKRNGRMEGRLWLSKPLVVMTCFIHQPLMLQSPLFLPPLIWRDRLLVSAIMWINSWARFLWNVTHSQYVQALISCAK
mgnify:CR=1 FL=1